MPSWPVISAIVVALLVLWVLTALLRLVGRFDGRRSRLVPALQVPASQDVPELADSEHHWIGEALVVGDFRVEEPAARMDRGDGVDWLRSWRSPDGRTRAVAITHIPETDSPVVKEPTTELILTSRIWLGGELRDIRTTDATTAPAWLPHACQVVRLPGATAEALWHIHRSRLDEATGSTIEEPLPSAAEELLDWHARLHAAGVEEGLVEADADEQLLTRAGAWAMTRTHMAPWSTRHDVRDRRAADGWLVV